MEEMRQGNVSRRRNPLIADLFRRIQMVEGWGRGMPLILENAPTVQFRQIAGLFIDSFERPSYLEEASQETVAESVETVISTGASVGIFKIIDSTDRKNDILKKVLDHLQNTYGDFATFVYEVLQREERMRS